MDPKQILCLVLMSCFDNQNPDNIKDSCKSYSAPNDGFDRSENSKSFICEDIKDLKENLLNGIKFINTLAVGISDDQMSGNKILPKTYYINNLYFYGKNSKPKINSILIEVEINSLVEISFVGLDLNSFKWDLLSQYKNLNVINIEECNLEKIDKNGFGLLANSNIFSLSIRNSNLKEIGVNTFEGWNQLKVLSFNGNTIRSMEWLDTRVPKLWQVDLRENCITKIPENLYKSVPNLLELRLDSNNLKFLTWTALYPLLFKLKLRTFSLRDNGVCINKGSIESFQEIDLIDTNEKQKLPMYFMRDIEKGLWCREFFNGGDILCMDYKKPTNMGIIKQLLKDKENEENCEKWDGKREKCCKKCTKSESLF